MISILKPRDTCGATHFFQHFVILIVTFHPSLTWIGDIWPMGHKRPAKSFGLTLPVNHRQNSKSGNPNSRLTLQLIIVFGLCMMS